MSNLRLKFNYEKNNCSSGGSPFWNLFITKDGLGEDEMADGGDGDSQR